MEHVCSVEQPTPWGGKGCKKGGKKESREKYSLCAGGVDWRVVGDEEGEGGGVEESFKAPRSCSILLRGPPGEPQCA